MVNLVHVEYSVYDPHIYKSNLSSGESREGPENIRREQNSNPDLCDAGAVLQQINYRRGQGSSPVQVRIFQAVLAAT